MGAGSAQQAPREPGAPGAPGAIGAWAAIRADLTGLARDLRTIVLLRAQRARLSASEGAHSLLLGAWLAVAAGTATAAAAVLVVVGLAGAAAALTGSLWAGALLSGGATLLACAGLLNHLRQRMRADLLASVSRLPAGSSESSAPRRATAGSALASTPNGGAA